MLGNIVLVKTSTNYVLFLNTVTQWENASKMNELHTFQNGSGWTFFLIMLLSKFVGFEN